MDVYTAFATDETLETEGKWFPLSKTASVKVARSGNAKYVEMLRARLKDAQLDLMATKEADELAESILVDVMAETVLLGWKGLTFQGDDLPVNAASARKLLAVKDFRRKVSGFSENFEAFRVKEEAEQGNA